MSENTAGKPASGSRDQNDGSGLWKRRGLFAAAWAAAAALVMRKSEQVVQADGTQGTPLTIGVLNTETAGTNLKWAGAPSNTVLLLGNDSFYAPTDAAFPAATAGWAAGSGGTFAGVTNGVYGYTERTGGNGAVGTSVNGTGSGVLGLKFSGAGFAVLGRTFSNVAGSGGVRGEIPSTVSVNGIAVYGVNSSPFDGGAPGNGGFGVYGNCAKGHGLVGATGTAGGAAVVGASNGVVDAFAGVFYGPVAVGGSFTVYGPKSAAVPHPDGSHRLVYCLECPESWLEDFGKAQLDCGETEVKIDPNFAAIADLTDYHVFLTQYGAHNDLCVTEQTPTGFRVKAKDGAGAGGFSWRIVGKRKDIVAERLAKATPLPELRLPPLADSDPESTGPRPTAQGRKLAG
jgi:hypothetical protein